MGEDKKTISAVPLFKHLDAERGAAAKLAKKLGVEHALITNWRSRGLPARWLPDVADYLGISADEYLVRAGRRPTSPARSHVGNELSPQSGITIERYRNPGSMGKGTALLESDQVVEQLTLTEERLALIAGRRKSYGSLKVIPAIGDSMEPTLRDGDFVLVDTSTKTVDIDGIFVLRSPDRLFIKRVSQNANGEKIVTSDNPAAPQWGILKKNLEVVGRVIWAWNGKKL